MTVLASRTFTSDDQLKFASLSGDFNPMHMDPVAARRSLAGAPVVHGIHLLLWLLDVLARHDPGMPFIGKLKCTFAGSIYLEEPVEAIIARADTASIRAEIICHGVTAVRVVANFAAQDSAGLDIAVSAPIDPGEPLSFAFEAMEGRSGWLALAGDPQDMAEAFPAAAGLLGATRLAALAGSSRLVGMVIPGLHSMYGVLSALLLPETGPVDRIAYRAVSTDARYRLVKLEMAGAGIQAEIDSFAIHPPTPQPGMADIAKLVRGDEFAGTTALIVGGSRGLGELTAKIIAAGGGSVHLTYALGGADAAIVAEAIRTGGGSAEILALDVRGDIDRQLGNLAPTHIYYYATPQIYRGKHAGFSQARFDEFVAFYVTGFYRLMQAALARRPRGLAAFYPSSVYVAERPDNMVEYAMAKAAGEVLCQDERLLKGARVVMARLPRLATDQTASLAEAETVDTLDYLLPIIRDVQRQ